MPEFDHFWLLVAGEIGTTIVAYLFFRQRDVTIDDYELDRLSRSLIGQLSGVLLAEPQYSLADRLVGNDDAPASHDVFNVAKAQRKPESRATPLG